MNKIQEDKKLLEKIDTVLGIKITEKKEQEAIPEEILELVEQRKKAREEKNWQLSEEIRDKIKEKGFIVKDTKEGMTIDKI